MKNDIAYIQFLRDRAIGFEMEAFYDDLLKKLRDARFRQMMNDKSIFGGNMNWKLIGSWCVVVSVLGYITAIMIRVFPPVFWVLFMEGVVIALGVISLLVLLFRSINYLDWYYCRRKIS